MVFWYRASHCQSLSCPGTHSVDQIGLESSRSACLCFTSSRIKRWIPPRHSYYFSSILVYMFVFLRVMVILKRNQLGSRMAQRQTWKTIFLQSHCIYSNLSPPMQSNETSNGYVLERSHSARMILAKTCDQFPEEVKNKLKDING